MIDQKTVLELAKKAGLLKYRSHIDNRPAFTFACGNPSVAVITKLIELSMQLGAELADARLEGLLEVIPEPPDANCSCFKSAPCNDCVDYSAQREAIKYAKEAISNRKDNHEQ